jgi:X-domain of DnaJ-containing
MSNDEALQTENILIKGTRNANMYPFRLTDTTRSWELLKKLQRKNATTLTWKLIERLRGYVEAKHPGEKDGVEMEQFVNMIRCEVEVLKKENFGVEVSSCLTI